VSTNGVDIQSAIRGCHLTITTCTEAIAAHGAAVSVEVVAAWESAITKARTDLAKHEAALIEIKTAAPKVFRGYVA